MDKPMQLGFDGVAVDPADLPDQATKHRETIQEREARFLANGRHPSGFAPLATGTDAGAGKRCKDCAFLTTRSGVAGRYHKCRLQRSTWTGGRGSDILVGWPACTKFEAKER